MSDEQLAANGINGDSGGYLLPSLTATQIAAAAQGKSPDEENAQELRARASEGGNKYRVNVDTRDLAKAGWGIIFAHGADPAVKDALAPLIEHRRRQAGERFKEFSGGKGFRPKDSKSSFLERAGAGPGAVNPDVVPYYLLIVGDPETVPYRFQYQLDVQYGVGRIHFDTPEEYARYAQSVVAAERGTVRRPRQATFFGVRTPGDKATELSADRLIAPLAEKVAQALAVPAAHTSWGEWSSSALIGEGHATKAQLATLLGGAATPALLFAASHGMGFERESPRQRQHQGALLCQDWPGPALHRGPIPEDFYFAADDLSDDACVAGLIAFCFACYGAGTPRLDEFAFSGGKRVAVAPEAFLARLPQRLLSHPKGGALAVVGHVERAWGHSFLWGRSGAQHQVFVDALRYLLAGQPVGAAMDWFNERYAELSTMLSQELEEIEYDGKVPEVEQLAMLWTANSDARNYVVIGDPAVRLAVDFPPDPPAETLAASIYGDNRQQAADNRQQTTGSRQQTTGSRQQATGNKQQATSNGRAEHLAAPLSAEAQAVPSSDTGAAPISYTLAHELAPAEPSVALLDPPAAASAAALPTRPPAAHSAGAAQQLAPSPALPTQPLAPDDPLGLVLDAGAAPTPEGAQVYAPDAALAQAKERIAAALLQIAEQLGALAVEIARGATNFEVATYSSDEGSAVTYSPASGRLAGGARLRALTRSSLDGRTAVLVPEKDGAIDSVFWQTHQEQVAEAAARQADTLRRALALATETMDALKRL